VVGFTDELRSEVQEVLTKLPTEHAWQSGPQCAACTVFRGGSSSPNSVQEGIRLTENSLVMCSVDQELSLHLVNHKKLCGGVSEQGGTFIITRSSKLSVAPLQCDTHLSLFIDGRRSKGAQLSRSLKSLLSFVFKESQESVEETLEEKQRKRLVRASRVNIYTEHNTNTENPDGPLCVAVMLSAAVKLHRATISSPSLILTKEDVRSAVMNVQSALPTQCYPSRHLFKQLNKYFLSM